MKRLLAAVLSLALLIVPAGAEAIEDFYAAVPETAAEGAADAEGSLKSIAEDFLSELRTSLSSALGKFAGLLLICLMCSLLGAFCSEDGPDTVLICGCTAICLILLSDASSFVEISRTAVSALAEFSRVLLPALCAAGAACGAISSVSAKYAASALFTDILISVIDCVFMPLLLSYAAVLIADAITGAKYLKGLSAVLKKLCAGVLSLTALSFTLYLTLTSLVSGAADTLTLKLAKTAIGAALPVVGSIMNDAAASVLAGAELLKSGIGALGMLSVLSICALPFAVLGIYYLVIKAAAVLSELFSVQRLSALIGGLASCFGLLLSAVGSCGIMLFITIISCMKAVSA